MSASVISSTQFWHSQRGPFAPFSQEKRGAERPVTGDQGEHNDNHSGYVLGADGTWTTRKGRNDE